MIPELVVFDCDGVLVDTEGPIFDVLCDSFTRYGLPMRAHEGASIFTGSTIEHLFVKAKSMGAALPDNWVSEINDAIHHRIAQGVDVFDGVLDLLDQLEVLNVPVFVASNGTQKRMSLSLGPSGIWDRLAGCILSCEAFAGKPDPAMILHAIEQTGASPSKSFMIDDSAAGCTAGINAGVRTIGFATEGQDDALAALGATVANSMADVKRLILA